MNNQLQVIIEEQQIEKSDAQKLVEAFGGPFDEAGTILANYKSTIVESEDDIDGMKAARESRLVLKRVRTTVENKRKELKSDIVKQGRAIDSVARYVKDQIEPAEQHLEQQEKFAEIKRAERAAKIKSDRIESLMRYTDDITLYDLDSITEDQFIQLLSNLKSQHEAKIAEEKRIEAERIAKEKAEHEENERIRKENELLKAEAQAKEKAEAEEREKRKIEEDKRLESERKERERIQAEADKKLKIEQEAREKLEAEARKREEDERKAKEAQEAEEWAAKTAGDNEKLKRFGNAIEVIRREKMPVMESPEYREIIEKIDTHLKSIQVLCNE